MSVLANFPMVSQRDGDLNQDDDCVAASIAAAMQWLTGQKYTAKEIKDEVYSPTYVGGTAAIAYVDYCAARGVTLVPINGDGQALVTALHNELADQHPVLITEPDPYESGWSHVCVAYKDSAGSITVMDPWIDQPVTRSDAEWASQLLDNQIWKLEKAMLAISEVSRYFSDPGNDVWKCENGHLLGHGILDYYRRTGSAPFFGLGLFGLPKTNEIAVTGHPGVVLQVFERAVLTYDPGHVLDNPPGGGPVYPMHIDGGIGLAQLAQFLPDPRSLPDAATSISDPQELQTATNAGLARVLSDLDSAPSSGSQEKS